MREFKFRAWDGGKMLYFSWENIDRSFVNAGEDSTDLLDKTVPVMQFTGLLDKNGKEVFEGDVLAFTSANPKNVGQVFNNVVEYFVGGTLCGFRMRRKQTCVSLNKNRMYRAEVVGNIHENPELLQP